MEIYDINAYGEMSENPHLKFIYRLPYMNRLVTKRY